MKPLDIRTAEISRKSRSIVLQRLAAEGQTHVAEMLGVSESTISRHKEERLEELLNLLAVLGLKVVSSNRVCVEEQEFLMMTRIVSRALANEVSARQVLFDEPE